jgi:hypothetical protein
MLLMYVVYASGWGVPWSRLADCSLQDVEVWLLGWLIETYLLAFVLQGNTHCGKFKKGSGLFELAGAWLC